jgi:hypothetical protein
MTAKKLSITSLEAEDHILVAGFTDNGQQLDAEQSKRLFNLPGKATLVTPIALRLPSLMTPTTNSESRS